MPRRNVLIIANPAAGRAGAVCRRLGPVIEALRRRGCTVTVRHAGAGEADAEALARTAEAAFEVIVAAGGDGTVNAVANGLAGSSRPLAVLPYGTANVLACEIGLPRRPEALAALIADGETRPVWPGRVGDRLFLTTASSGFDAETVAAVNPRLKRRLGRLAVVCAILIGIARYRRRELRVCIDGVEHRAATVIAAKTRHYAGPFVIAPRADLADPVLDFLLFRRAGRGAAIRAIVALLRGRLWRCTDVEIVRGRTAQISAAGSLPVQADGEIVGRLPVALDVAERPLPLITP